MVIEPGQDLGVDSGSEPVVGEVGLRTIGDPDGIITGGHDNKTARTVAVRQGGTVNAPALTAMFRHIIANNRAGGWRKLKRES